MKARPNILLVVFDSLSARHLNARIPELPTLRRLMSESLNFAAAYTCCPESSPARASLFTGLDMAAHGVWTDGVALPKRESSMPAIFAQNGYHTWLVGRRHLARVSTWTTEHAGHREYHHFDWAHGPLHRARQNAYLTWLQAKHPEQYATIFPRQADPDDAVMSAEQRARMSSLPDELSFNAWVGQGVRSHITAAPFFGVVGFVVGADMGVSATTIETLDDRALDQADAALGAILEALPENTVVVLTAGRGSVDAGSSDPLQENAIQVPLLLRLETGETAHIETPVSTMDIASTVYAIAGVVAPQRLQGHSLTASKARGWALSRLRTPGHRHQTALKAGNWKLIVTHGAPEATRLFDLCTDPDETRNLAHEPRHQDALETLIDTMIDARVALEDRTEPRIAKF